MGIDEHRSRRAAAHVRAGANAVASVLALLLAVAPGASEARAQNAPVAPHAARPDTGSTKVRVAIAHALPPLDGNHLKATVVEVTYGPGGRSAPHSHPCPVIGYVVRGSLRTQVRGEPEAVYTAGESFYEAPNSAHVVSANASREQPVTFLAYFVCDRNAPLSAPLPEPNRGQGR